MILAERARVLSELQELLQDARAGDGSVVLITGPVAVGKTELAHSLARSAEKESQLLVLRGQASASGKNRNADLLEQLTESLQSTNYWADDQLPLTRRGVDRTPSRVAHEIARCSKTIPLLIVVDDLQHSDPESLDAILHLIRLSRTSRIMLVLVVAEGSQLLIPLIHAELLRAPHCWRKRLPPLSPSGVAEVVTRAFGPDVAERTVDDYYRYSGGNPLVLRALIEEQGSTSILRRADGEPAAPGAVAELEAGQVSALAVFTSLHRGGAETMAVARGIALLGVAASVELLALVLKADVDHVAGRVMALEEAGLLNEGQFRHPGVAEAVLSDPEFTQIQVLRYEVARVLEAEGHSRQVVARQLVASRAVTEPWTVDVLRESAVEAVSQNDWSFASKCLDLALQGQLSEADKGLLITDLLQVQWKLNPARLIKYLPECFQLQQTGHIPDLRVIAVLKLFLWHGHVDEAAEMVLDIAGRGERAEVQKQLYTFLEWARIGHPRLLKRVREANCSLLPALAESAGHELPRPVAALRKALSDSDHGEVAAMVEDILTAEPADSDSSTSALQALLYADELVLAESWFDRTMRDMEAFDSMGSRGIHYSIRAETVRRRGDLQAAERNAATALRYMAPRAWGVALGLPLGTLVAAHVARGNLEKAQEYLSWVVPRGMFLTVFGLNYLEGRARYFLATGQYTAARQDFLECGELMKSWDLDLPPLVPWRVGAAEAALAQGDRREARRLIGRQLEQPRAQSPRLRGMALRVYAPLVGRHRRVAILQEAADLLSGADRYQHFLALTDLSRAHQGAGDAAEALVTGRRAWRGAVRCGAERVARTLLPDSARTAPVEPEEPPADSQDAVQLSEAELRVAKLAAAGETNREISVKLFITVSTVEQHLTRVYRKLQVSGRADLRDCLAGRLTCG